MRIRRGCWAACSTPSSTGARGWRSSALAEYVGVQLYIGVTDEYHSTQMLADVMACGSTSDKPVSQIKYAYVGMDVRLAGRKKLWPADDFMRIARGLEKQYGAKPNITEDPQAAVKDVDFIHTDVWVSMGDPGEVWKERIDLLKKYEVTAALTQASGNPQVKFMHCLPAFHDTKTRAGKDIAQAYGCDKGLEVADDVFESEANVAFDHAENRMHTIEGILVATLGD